MITEIKKETEKLLKFSYQMILDLLIWWAKTLKILPKEIELQQNMEKENWYKDKVRLKIIWIKETKSIEGKWV